MSERLKLEYHSNDTLHFKMKNMFQNKQLDTWLHVFSFCSVFYHVLSLFAVYFAFLFFLIDVGNPEG